MDHKGGAIVVGALAGDAISGVTSQIVSSIGNAKELKRIDREYEKARSNAQNLPLEKKVKAYREAKEARDKAYDAIKAKMAK